MGSCPSFFHVLSVFLRFSVVLYPRDRLGGLGGKVGSACEEFEDKEGLLG